jgi:hypothetical protein
MVSENTIDPAEKTRAAGRAMDRLGKAEGTDHVMSLILNFRDRLQLSTTIVKGELHTSPSLARGQHMPLLALQSMFCPA